MWCSSTGSDLCCCLHGVASSSSSQSWSITMIFYVFRMLARAAVSGLICCASASVQMRCLSTTRSTWFIVATLHPLAWRECGGEKRKGSPARTQLVLGQCIQRRRTGLKVSAGGLTELRPAKVDSSLAGTCMSCRPVVGLWLMLPLHAQ